MSTDQLSSYLVRECERILEGEAALREGAEVDLVHDIRVGVRRLRSTIRVFAPLLAPGPGELTTFDDDLRWLAGLLSEVRDVDVLGRLVRRQLEELPAELVMGPVAQEVDVALAETRSAALDRWRRARDDERYARTLATVTRWQGRPPVADGLTSRRLAKQGGRLLKQGKRKARRRLRSAGDDPAAVHRARKATKRLRYTADLLGPVVPKAAATRKRAKRLQSSLGHHQDLVVEIGFLRDQAARFGGQEGHNGFTYGQLRGRAEAEAAGLRHAAVS